MDANVSAFWRKSAHHPELAHLRGQRPGKSLLGFTVQPPCGTGGETGQEGKDLRRVLQLVGGQSQDADLGSGALRLQPQLCSIPGSCCNLSGKGRYSPGGCEDSCISRTQTGSGHSKYLTLGHYYQRCTFCVERHSQGRTGEAVSPQHWGRALSVSRVLPIPSLCLPPPHCAKCCELAGDHSV